MVYQWNVFDYLYATKLYIACSYVQCFYNKAEYFHKIR